MKLFNYANFSFKNLWIKQDEGRYKNHYLFIYWIKNIHATFANAGLHFKGILFTLQKKNTILAKRKHAI
jgi:hypothetical protein